MTEIISVEEIIELARQYDVDQSDMLETFICELLYISPDKLYELLEKGTQIN